jgi:hypothetical protein
MGCTGHRRRGRPLGGLRNLVRFDAGPLEATAVGAQATGFRAPRQGQTSTVGDSAHVEAARIPDRDRLLEELRAAGLEARPLDEVGIEVKADDEALLAEVEGLISSLGAPFVPMKHDGVIYIRPPLG